MERRLCKNLFLLLLMAAMVTPAVVQAKKIKYGVNVLYDGKAKKDIPTGVGTLTSVVGSGTDVLAGNFTGDGTVTDAQLKFPSGWKFTGTLSYQVEIDGSTVTYQLTEGDLYVVSASVYSSNVMDFTLKVTPETAVTLVRTTGRAFDLKKFVFDTTVPAALVSDQLTAPISISMLGDKSTCTAKANCTILPTGKVEATSGPGTDVMGNLRAKDFSSVTEPWTFLARPSAVCLANGVKAELFEGAGKAVWSILWPDDKGVFCYTKESDAGKSVVKAIAKVFANGTSVAYSDMEGAKKKGDWVLNYADKSRAKGQIFFKVGTVEINAGKSLEDYSATTVFNAFMSAKSLEDLNARPYNYTLTKPDGATVEYRRGMSADDVKARTEALAKAMENGEPLRLEPCDVLGQWRMRDPAQGFNSHSFYTLELEDGGRAELRLTADHYATYGIDYDTHPYYVRKVFSIAGNYRLQDDKIVFTWDASTRKVGNQKAQFGSSSYYSKALTGKLDAQAGNFATLYRESLALARVSSISESDMVINDNLSFARVEETGAEPSAASLPPAEADCLNLGSNGFVTSFKHHYKDGVVTIENGKMTIDYANGDRYEGTGHVGVINSQGKMPGNSYGDKFSDYRQFTDAVMGMGNIADLEVYYENGTLTKLNGTTLKFTDGFTEKQQNQIDKNLVEAVNTLNKMLEQQARELKTKSLFAKQQLLSEGFAPAYVNSMFDQFRILPGTPKALVDRAIQLGCHITRHPVVMRDPSIFTRDSGTTYAVVVTDYNTGLDAFEGFVKFHWLTKRAIYVGRQMQ